MRLVLGSREAIFTTRNWQRNLRNTVERPSPVQWVPDGLTMGLHYFRILVRCIVHAYGWHFALLDTSITGYLFPRETCETGVPVLADLIGRRSYLHDCKTDASGCVATMDRYRVASDMRLCQEPHGRNSEWYLFSRCRAYGKYFNTVCSLSWNGSKIRFVNDAYFSFESLKYIAQNDSN